MLARSEIFRKRSNAPRNSSLHFSDINNRRTVMNVNINSSLTAVVFTSLCVLLCVDVCALNLNYDVTAAGSRPGVPDC